MLMSSSIGKEVPAGVWTRGYFLSLLITVSIFNVERLMSMWDNTS